MMVFLQIISNIKPILITLIVAMWISCEKDPTSVKKEGIPDPSLKGIFILNEGSFSAANASLSYFDSDSNKMYNNVFFATNGDILGSVGNSVSIFDTIAFIVVNNSDKIEVISVNSFKRRGTIHLPPGSSPRNLAVLNASKGYVSNLYTNSCAIIDLSTYQVDGSIATGSNPEGLVIANSKLYVANSGFGYGNTMTVISTTIDEVVDSIKIGDNPITVKKDEGENVFVLCSGSYNDWNDPNDDTPGSVWKINSMNDSVIDSLIIPGHPSRLCLGEGDNGYFINGGAITEFDTQNMRIVNDTIVAGNFYGLNYDPVSQMIYALDPKDYFSQNGEMIIFGKSGMEFGRHEVGLIPGTLAFYSK
jgi:YVTN family beta-propeller protein